MKDIKLSRREVLGYSAAGAVGASMLPGQLLAQSSDIITKTIPSSGEAIPPIGCGTNRYGTGTDPEAFAEILETVDTFQKLGGKLIDTAPIYGDSEMVIGNVLAELGNREDFFLATKTDMRGQVQGADSFEQSFTMLQTDHVELMQVHNLMNTSNELAAMREYRADGRIRYIGITTSQDNQYGQMEDIINSEEMDFIQVNYSLADRSAADRLLPLAQEKGLAVLCNLPFGRASMFDAVDGMELPDWAAEADINSWAQFFLKYIISHPAVTAAIPGTRRPHYAVDNFGAAMGRLPDADMRRRMETFFDDLA